MADKNKAHENIRFHLIHTPCCGQLLCWVNPRLPNYCPECGKGIFLKKGSSSVLFIDQEAWLSYHIPENMANTVVKS